MFKAIKKFFDDLFKVTVRPSKKKPVIDWECPVCGCREYKQSSHKEYKVGELGGWEDIIYDPYYHCVSCTLIFKDPEKVCLDKNLMGCFQTQGSGI